MSSARSVSPWLRHPAAKGMLRESSGTEMAERPTAAPLSRTIQLGLHQTARPPRRALLPLPTSDLRPSTFDLRPSTFRPSDLPTFRPSDLPTFRPSDLPTFRPLLIQCEIAGTDPNGWNSPPMYPHPRLTSSRGEADHRREPPATPGSPCLLAFIHKSDKLSPCLLPRPPSPSIVPARSCSNCM